jgi:hypothetical protein
VQVLQPGDEMRVFVDVTVGARLWHEHGLTHRHGGVDEDNVPLVTKDMQPLEVTVSSLTFPGTPEVFRVVGVCCRRTYVKLVLHLFSFVCLNLFPEQ